MLINRLKRGVKRPFLAPKYFSHTQFMINIKTSLLISTLLFSGCQTVTHQKTPDITTQPNTHFHIESRFSVNSTQKTLAGNLDWTHTDQKDNLIFRLPILNTELARLIRSNDKVTFSTKDKVVSAKNLPELAKKYLGFSALPPLDTLAKIMLAQTKPIKTRNQYGQPETAIVGEWLVEYKRFESNSSNSLPKLIFLHKDSIKVKIAIQRWSLAKQADLD